MKLIILAFISSFLFSGCIVAPFAARMGQRLPSHFTDIHRTLTVGGETAEKKEEEKPIVTEEKPQKRESRTTEEAQTQAEVIEEPQILDSSLTVETLPPSSE